MNRVRDLSARWIRDAAFMEFDIKIQILMWYLGDSTIQYCTVTISNAIFGKGSLLRNEPQYPTKGMLRYIYYPIAKVSLPCLCIVVECTSSLILLKLLVVLT